MHALCIMCASKKSPLTLAVPRNLLLRRRRPSEAVTRNPRPGLPPRPPSAKVHPTGARGDETCGTAFSSSRPAPATGPSPPAPPPRSPAPRPASPSTSTPTRPSPTRPSPRSTSSRTVWFRSRIDAMARTRFERTLHLDADVLAVADLRDVFEVLDRFDIALAHDQRRNSPAANATWRRPLPNAFPQFNGGVIAYRRTPGSPRLPRRLGRRPPRQRPQARPARPARAPLGERPAHRHPAARVQPPRQGRASPAGTASRPPPASSTTTASTSTSPATGARSRPSPTSSARWPPPACR